MVAFHLPWGNKRVYSCFGGGGALLVKMAEWSLVGGVLKVMANMRWWLMKNCTLARRTFARALAFVFIVFFVPLVLIGFFWFSHCLTIVFSVLLLRRIPFPIRGGLLFLLWYSFLAFFFFLSLRVLWDSFYDFSRCFFPLHSTSWVCYSSGSSSSTRKKEKKYLLSWETKVFSFPYGRFYV